MVKASTSVRRSSRDKSSNTPSNASALNPDGVALDLLRQVIETEGRIITDPRNKLNVLLVKDGAEFSSSGEGKDWVPGHADPEQGFTFQNNGHKDHVDMLEDWQHRLPEEARALIPADKLIAVELVANVSPETTKKDKASKSTTAGKRKNKKPRKVNFHFGEDVPEELHEGAAEWKQCVEKGGEQFFGAGEPAKSLKDLEKQIKETIRSFAYCADGQFRVTSHQTKAYKAKHLDPVAKRLITAVKRNVAQQAAQLEKEILEDLCLSDYHLENTFNDDVLENEDDKVNDKENTTPMTAVEE
eukprot:scaffold19770_cov44-Cyclotella_meneghiniana.AAC.7